MKRGNVFAILLLVAVVLGIAIIDSSSKRPIDWSKSYNFRDKIPFGLFVFHQEISNILGEEKSLSDYTETIYELFMDSTHIDNDRAIINVAEDILFDTPTTKYTLDFVKNGGEIFLATTGINEALLDTLGLAIETLDYVIFRPTDDRVTYSLVGDTARVKLKKVDSFAIFSKLNSQNSTILGYTHARGRAIPNFIKVSHGKGALYLHLVPELFTNYHLLQKPSYELASQALGVLKNSKVLLIDNYYDWDQPRTPLRVILTHPGFAQAWYLLLAGLLLLLIFKSKREQRAVKVVTPEPNLSKEFAMTIGNLYYENGTPGNIIQKKIEYFLFTIRSNYHLDTLELLDSKFLKQLSLKAGVDLDETTQLFTLLDNFRNKEQGSIEDLKNINSKIEAFKQKANII